MERSEFQDFIFFPNILLVAVDTDAGGIPIGTKVQLH